MLKRRTALGIDVSRDTIYLALLKQGKDGVELLKTACGPVPEGAVSNGSIIESAVLAKAIKKLTIKNKMTAGKTAMSLLVNPTLLQIMELPGHTAGNIRGFIRNKLKDYAILPMQKIAFDFSGIKSLGRSLNRRVFVVATDGQEVSDIIKALSRIHVHVDTIEPAPAAYIRACYARKIAANTECNQLFAIVHEGTFTLCLFRNQTLDFIRAKRFEAGAGSEEYFEWLIEEINAIVQYYELEVPDNCGKWELTLALDECDGAVERKLESLRPRLNKMGLGVRTPEDAYRDTPIGEVEQSQAPSAIAIGLAMRLLDAAAYTPNINLVPSKAARHRAAQKQTMTIANTAAVLLLLLILSIGFFRNKTESIDENAIQQEQIKLSRTAQELVNEQVALNSQIATLSEKLNTMNDILSESSTLLWDRILSDIGQSVSRNVQITSVSYEDNRKMLLEGRAVSLKAVYELTDRLAEAESIESASMGGTRTDSGTGRLVMYSINCMLRQERDE